MMENQNKWCYKCLETLGATDPTQHNFVKCQSCLSQSLEVYYHLEHWQELQSCLHCQGNHVIPVTINRPSKLIVVEKSKPFPLYSTEHFTQFNFQTALKPINPFNQLRRLWWLIFDPISASSYAKQHGAQEAANLDWWLSCTLIYLIGYLLAIGTLILVSSPGLLIVLLTIIFLVAWWITGKFGTLKENELKKLSQEAFARLQKGANQTTSISLKNIEHTARGTGNTPPHPKTVIGRTSNFIFVSISKVMSLIGAFLLGVVTILSIFVVFAEPYVFFAILEKLNFPFLSQSMAFRPTFVGATGWAPLIVIAIALSIIPQVPDQNKLKSLAIHLTILIAGGIIIPLSFFKINLIFALIIFSLVLPWILFVVIRASRDTDILRAFAPFQANIILYQRTLKEKLPILERLAAFLGITTFYHFLSLVIGFVLLINSLVTLCAIASSITDLDTVNAIANNTPLLCEFPKQEVACQELNAKMQKGDTNQTFRIELQNPSPILWSRRWCAIDQATLRNNLAKTKFSFWINNDPIRLDWFIQQPYQDNGQSCYRYALLLPKLETGYYERVSKIELIEPVNNGSYLYPTATHTQTFMIEVK